ncbi:MAG TPA: hypothetical protein VFO39_18650 [Candidatus Sulfotelmatobacter sp.]|nr:hypothetical protein [Candidatus Sulfotelmatobacter sp.]
MASSLKLISVWFPVGSVTVVVHVDPGPGTVVPWSAREYCQQPVGDVEAQDVVGVSIRVSPAVLPSLKMPVLFVPPL